MKGLFSTMQMALSKNAVEFALQANVASLYAVSHCIPKRRNSTASKSEDFYGCRILMKAYFRQCR